MKRYETVAAFESALRARLHALATKEQTFQYLRRQVAFGRVLARLQAAAPEAWLLKGGVALEYRVARARATLDIDITTNLDLNDMSDVLTRAEATDLFDYFQIEIGERERPVDDVNAYRFHVAVKYADGRPFEPLKLDIGFADPWLGVPVTLDAPSLLEFAGIAPTTLRTIPAAQQLAEKIHAYTKSYGSHTSSRVKDFVDIALLLGDGVDLNELQTMLRFVFASRRTHAVPAELKPPSEAWRIPYGKLAAGLPVPQNLDDCYQFAAARLSSVLASLKDSNGSD